MRNRFLLLIIFTLSVLGVRAQSSIVRNVDSRQDGDKVRITYTLDRKADISVSYSVNGGLTYHTMHSVTGDVGEKVSAGSKTIVWDVLSDIDELKGNNIVFKVDAVDIAAVKKEAREYEPAWILALQFGFAGQIPVTVAEERTDVSASSMMGFTIGYARRAGAYLSAQFPLDKAEAKAIEEKHRDYSAFTAGCTTVAVGAVIRLYKNLYIYGGPAYVSCRIREYSREQKYEPFENNSMVAKVSSIGLDAGISIHLAKYIVFSGGVTAPFQNKIPTIGTINVGISF